jgi:hypothetical protein
VRRRSTQSRYIDGVGDATREGDNVESEV